MEKMDKGERLGKGMEKMDKRESLGKGMEKLDKGELSEEGEGEEMYKEEDVWGGCVLLFIAEAIKS